MAKGKVVQTGKSRVKQPRKVTRKLRVAGAKARVKKAALVRQANRTKDATQDAVSAASRFLSSDGLVDVDRVAEAFGMTKASLAATLGFADDTLQRFSRAAAPKTQQRLREMLEILTRVERWAGGMPQALGWYRGQGIPALGDQTAEALVQNDQAFIVRRYLDGLAAGSYA
jgi:ribosome-binding protein aMBF1 (putative translation factor)